MSKRPARLRLGHNDPDDGKKTEDPASGERPSEAHDVVSRCRSEPSRRRFGNGQADLEPVYPKFWRRDVRGRGISLIGQSSGANQSMRVYDEPSNAVSQGRSQKLAKHAFQVVRP